MSHSFCCLAQFRHLQDGPVRESGMVAGDSDRRESDDQGSAFPFPFSPHKCVLRFHTDRGGVNEMTLLKLDASLALVAKTARGTQFGAVSLAPVSGHYQTLALKQCSNRHSLMQGDRACGPGDSHGGNK
jgi:hypothetical protein